MKLRISIDDLELNQTIPDEDNSLAQAQPWRPEDEAKTRQQISQYMFLIYASLAFLKDKKPGIIWGMAMSDFNINWTKYADAARNS